MLEPDEYRTTYNRIYTSYLNGELTHAVSLADLTKAKRRVEQVCRAFNISLESDATRVLDVGCGLGSYTEALRLAGALATGIDIADAGIEQARRAFPSCHFIRGAFPADVSPSGKFHLIWSIDFSLLNTFDVATVQREFVSPALDYLEPGGVIVIGWHTNFSGKSEGNWAHWAPNDFAQLRAICGFSEPRIIQFRNSGAGVIVMSALKYLRKSAPVFFVRKHDQTQDHESDRHR